ncbi:MAG TPA: DNA repair protein RecO, partial [Burkholderiales bacterium]|nr:DNA repair protein RecO [Burkholderiales bacterium]
MRVQQQYAFILHQRDFSETSLLLEIFSRRHGRVGLIAKGARRPGARNRGVLKPFQQLLVGWSGRGELMVLTGAETDGANSEVVGNWLYCAFYLNELVLRLLHRHDPHEGLYDRYRAAIEGLCQARRPEAILRIFEKHLMRELGYGLLLEREHGNRDPIEADAIYDYVPEHGPVRVRHPELGARVRGVRLRGSSLLALAAEQLDDATVLREAKALMR